MSHYVIRRDPSTPNQSDRAIRNAASRRGVMVHYDPVLGKWSLIEPRLRLPIGDPLPSLAAVARIVYGIPLPKRRNANGRGKAGKPCPVADPIRVVDLLAQEEAHHG